MLDVGLALSVVGALYLTILVPIPLGDRPARHLDLIPRELVALLTDPTTGSWARAVANLALLLPMGALLPLRAAAVRSLRRTTVVVLTRHWWKRSAHTHHAGGVVGKVTPAPNR